MTYLVSGASVGTRGTVADSSSMLLTNTVRTFKSSFRQKSSAKSRHLHIFPSKILYTCMHRFHDVIQDCLSQAKDEGQPLSLPMTTQEERDLDHVEYELDSNNLPVVLGSGAFGRVYSAMDSITKKKLAVKEIKVSETDEG